MNKILKIYLFIFICTLNILSSTKEASINLKLDLQKDTVQISKLMHGGFFEFLTGYINGTNGVWAQEFVDRGFDILDYSLEHPYNWYKLSTDSSNSKFLLSEGGYNKNGRYYQKLINNISNISSGIYQKIYINDSIPNIFYIYARTTNSASLKVSVYDTLIKTKLYESNSINLNISDEWKKFTFDLPAFKGYNQVCVLITNETQGTLDIDEASWMPANNVNGVRREYFNLFKSWKPTLLRYPGGGFADRLSAKLDYMIGNIDQRKSPNLSFGETSPIDMTLGNERLDFGVREFMLLLDSLSCEPLLVTNFDHGTITEAMNWLEYMNKDTNTVYGKKRKEDGKEESYKAKYWEIGNEQWSDIENYAKDYTKYYDSLKKSDPDGYFIVNSQNANEEEFFTVMDIAKDKTESVSYHALIYGDTENGATSTDVYYSIMGTLQYLENCTDRVEKNLKQLGVGEKVTHAVTEWWSNYGGGLTPGWLLDTNYRNHSLEAGISNAVLMNIYLRNSKDIILANRTIGIGLIKRDLDTLTGRRYMYGGACFHVMEMLSNHTGEYLINNTAKVEKQNYTIGKKGYWDVYNLPMIDVTTSKTKDTLYCSVINKYPFDSVAISINTEYNLKNRNAVEYLLYSDSLDDENTKYNTDKVVPKQRIISFNDTLKLPPHSFCILAIDIKDAKLNNQDSTNITKDDIINLESKIKQIGNRLIIAEEKLVTENLVLKIIDSKGNEFMPKVSKDISGVSIDISNLSSGIYLLALEAENLKKVCKFNVIK